jgi:putative salt-induced outer membrane protein YdiY
MRFKNICRVDRMKEQTKDCLFLITFLSLPGLALADTVFLKNGDRITGTVLKLTDDTLLIGTTYAGDIKISWQEVSRLATDEPVRLETKGKEVLSGTLSTSRGGRLSIQDPTSGDYQDVPLTEITAINPPDESDLKFSGHLNLGLTRQRGNTKDDTYHVDGETVLRWPDDRVIISFNADFETTDEVDTQQSANLYGTYDHFFSEKWFMYNGLSFEHDKFSDLRLRTTASIGAGYQVIETEDANLSIQLGPGYVWEDLYESPNRDYAAGVWSLRYDQLLVKDWNLKAFHNHRLSQSLESTSDYVFISQTGLRAPIFGNFQGTLQFNFDRDNEPGANTKKNDYKYLITLGYAW